MNRINLRRFKSSRDGHDVAVLIVDKPFDFDDYVRPIRLQSNNWYHRFEGGIMVASGMGMINNNESTSELKLASIQMLKKSECKKLLENTFTFPYKGRRPDSNIKLLISIFRWYNLRQGCNKYMWWWLWWTCCCKHKWSFHLDRNHIFRRTLYL